MQRSTTYYFKIRRKPTPKNIYDITGTQLKYKITIIPGATESWGTATITKANPSDKGWDITLDVDLTDDTVTKIYTHAVKEKAKENGVDIKEINCKKSLAFAPIPVKINTCTIRAEAPNFKAIQDTFAINYNLWEEHRKAMRKV